MDLLKKEVHTNVVKIRKEVQITVDEDLNVPDSKPDIEKLIQSKGEFHISQIEVFHDKIRLKGQFLFRCLYITGNAGPALGSFSHSFDMEEYINIDGVKPTDIVKAKVDLDDLNVLFINSRKIGVRGLLTFQIAVNETLLIQGAIKPQTETNVECLYEKLNVTQLVVNKKDTARVKGEMAITASKPNVRAILWEEIELRTPEVRVLDQKIIIRGELIIFVLYLGEEEQMPIQYVEWEMPFESEVECLECKEEMIGNVKINAGARQIEVKSDADGEERILGVEATLDLDIKLYEEEKIDFLSDIYSTSKEIELMTSPFRYENLIVRNNAKTKIIKRMRLKENQERILQIVHTDGSVKIDEIEMEDEKIAIEGVILVELLYITGNDQNPMNCLSNIVPFEYVIEAKGVREKDHYEIHASLEQLSAIMLDGEEVEIKAVIGMDMIAFADNEGMAIIKADEKPFDYEKLKNIPGMIGYIVSPQDTLWNIAKKYHTTRQSIIEMNDMTSEDIKEGEKLLIVKQTDAVL